MSLLREAGSRWRGGWLLLAIGMATTVGNAGCAEEEVGDVGELKPSQVMLDAPARLVRASIALRGIRPSVADLQRVADDGAALADIVDGYLADPAFGEVIRDMHNEALQVRVDYGYYPAGFTSIGGVADMDRYALNRSLQEASLRLVEHVVMNDRPYTEMVTADYQLANRAVAEVWGSLSYDPNGPEWQETKWTDGRPAAGVLSDPFVFTRHNSTPSNANRGRANAMSKALICYDFLSRDIEVDGSLDLADPAVVANAVKDNDACAACHQSLDPLAAFFQDYYPIYVPEQLETYPFNEFYFPGIFDYVNVEFRDRGYFGRAGDNVADLGQLIAEDPRFSLCAAQRFYAYLHQVGLEHVPQERAAHLQGVLIDSGYNAKALARSIVLADDFHVSHADDATLADTRSWVLKLRPEQLDSMVLDMTGYRWTTDMTPYLLGEVPLLEDSFLGFSVLGGGIDSMFVTRPSHTFNGTSALLAEALAGNAASWVVTEDFALTDPNARRLLRLVEADSTDEAQVKQQLAWLHARIYGEIATADSDAIAASYTLFRAALDHSNSPARAWQTTLSAMLQDIRFVSY